MNPPLPIIEPLAFILLPSVQTLQSLHAILMGMRYSKMTIERAQAADAAALTDIAFAAKRYWGYPETWIESWRGVLTLDPEFIANH